MTSGIDGHLIARLRDVEERLRMVVECRRADDPAPDDPFRGLYINEESVERLLAGPESIPPFGADPPIVDDGGPLTALARIGGLTTFELRLLVTVLVPDLDTRFERLYGYLNDDVTRRRASIGLALELAGASTMNAAARRALSPSGRLVDLGLVLVEDPERPYLTRSLRVPDRVIAHLLGDSSADPSTELVLLEVEGHPSPLSARLTHALEGGVGVVHIREREGGTAAATAVAALQAFGHSAVVADLTRLVGGSEVADRAQACAREALLCDAGWSQVRSRISPRGIRRSSNASADGRPPCCSSGPRGGTPGGHRRRRCSLRLPCSVPANGSRCSSAISITSEPR